MEIKENIQINKSIVKDKIVNNKSKKTRDMNFELLRIVLMLMIIFHHFVLHGKVLDNMQIDSLKFNIIYFLEFMCIVAVNCYVMITGYYMINKKCKIKKVVSLFIETLFYSVTAYVFMIAIGKQQFKAGEFVKALFPISTREYWFMAAYFGLYLFIPFINKMVEKINEKQYSILLIISTILLSIVKTIYPENGVFEASGGYSLIWFMYLYLLAGYIRLYKNNDKTKTITWTVLYFLMVVVQLVIRNLLNIKCNTQYLHTLFNNLLNYNSIFILIESVALFMIFKNIKIKSKPVNKIIAAVAPLTLAVYLIQESNAIRDVLWLDIIAPVRFIYNGKKLIILAIVSVIGIFTICCIIEKVRQILFKQIDKLKINKKINEKLNIYMDKYNDMVNLDN